MVAQPSGLEARLLEIIHDFLQELESERALRGININSELDRDLGIDSLGKVELFQRIEKAFIVQLPENIIVDVITVKDLMTAVSEANPPPKLLEKEFSPALKKANIDPSDATNLVDVLLKYALTTPERPHIFLQVEQGIEKTITYGDLYLNSSNVARGLIKKGIRPGETVALMLPTSTDFFYSFFGILLAGAIPVPIYPPFRPDKIEEYATREAAILNNAEARVLIIFQQVERLGKILKALIPSKL